jgi:hypothetical protein
MIISYNMGLVTTCVTTPVTTWDDYDYLKMDGLP